MLVKAGLTGRELGLTGRELGLTGRELGQGWVFLLPVSPACRFLRSPQNLWPYREAVRWRPAVVMASMSVVMASMSLVANDVRSPNIATHSSCTVFITDRFPMPKKEETESHPVREYIAGRIAGNTGSIALQIS